MNDIPSPEEAQSYHNERLLARFHSKLMEVKILNEKATQKTNEIYEGLMPLALEPMEVKSMKTFLGEEVESVVIDGRTIIIKLAVDAVKIIQLGDRDRCGECLFRPAAGITCRLCMQPPPRGVEHTCTWHYAHRVDTLALLEEWDAANGILVPDAVGRFEDNDIVLNGCHMRKERADGGE